MLITVSFAWFYKNTSVEVIVTNVGNREIEIKFFKFDMSDEEKRIGFASDARLYNDSYYDPVVAELVNNLEIYPNAHIYFKVEVTNLGSLDSKLSITFKNMYDNSPNNEELLLKSMILNVSKIKIGTATIDNIPYNNNFFRENMTGEVGSRQITMLSGVSLPKDEKATIYYNFQLATNVQGDITAGYLMTVKQIYFMLT